MSPLWAIVALAAGIVNAADTDPNTAGSVVGAFIFMRHGDRLIKPTNILTPLGQQGCFNAGTYWRERYLNSSSPYHINGTSEVYSDAQIAAYAPNNDVLQKSALSFLQGFYPPISDIDEPASSVAAASLANGSYAESPLDGYQYVYYTGVGINDVENFQIQGSCYCPTWTAQSDMYFNTQEFSEMNSSTLSFYQSLSKVLDGTDLTPAQLNYGNAYHVYDFFNVESIHNETFAKLVDDNNIDMLMIKSLSDIYSRSLNYNFTQGPTGILTLGGQGLGDVIATAANASINGSTPITYSSGSYNNFYQLWGFLDMYSVNVSKYTGIINYSAQVSFEFVELDSANYARVVFRNGSDLSVEPEYLQLPGFNSTLMPIDQFLNSLSGRPTSSNEWCGRCSATSMTVCAAYFGSQENDDLSNQVSQLTKDKKLAAGLGVSMTFVATALAAAVLIFFLRRRWLAEPAHHVADADTLRASEAGSVGSKAEA